MGKRLKLGEMLVAKGLVSAAQLDAALAEQRRWGKRLGMTLVLLGFLEEETLIRTLAAQLKLPVARIRGKRVNAEVVELVPVELAEKHRCLPLFVKSQEGSRELFLAMEDPSDLDAQGSSASASASASGPCWWRRPSSRTRSSVIITGAR